MPLCTLLAFASADHGRIEPQLERTTLCLEPRSVETEVSGPGAPQTAPFKRELREQLEATLSRADVRYEVKGSCEGRRAALLLDLDARYLDPETYLGFPENAYTYVVSLQVGTLAEDEVLEPLYVTTTSDIISITDAEAQLLFVVEPSLSELARTWRQSNLVSFAQHLAFSSLALLLVGARAVLRWAL